MEDGAGNISIPLTAKVTISGADTVKPAVASANATSPTTIKVKFAEAITNVDATKVKFNGTAVATADAFPSVSTEGVKIIVKVTRC